MPLTGSGGLIGAATMLAIGNVDPVAVPEFAGLADALGAWCLTNCTCLPGTMVAAGTAVSGAGLLTFPSDGAGTLGPALATAMKDPSAGGVLYWTRFASALLGHMTAFGQVNPSTFAAAPAGGPLTGTGTVAFTSLVFAPPVSSQLGVSDAVAAAMLEVFGAQLLTGIKQYAQALPIALTTPFVPFTAPPGGGPITGAGSLA